MRLRPNRGFPRHPALQRDPQMNFFVRLVGQFYRDDALDEATREGPDRRSSARAGAFRVILPCDAIPHMNFFVSWPANFIRDDAICEATRRQRGIGRVRLRPNRGFPCLPALRRDPQMKFLCQIGRPILRGMMPYTRPRGKPRLGRSFTLPAPGLSVSSCLATRPPMKFLCRLAGQFYKGMMSYARPRGSPGSDGASP